MNNTRSANHSAREVILGVSDLAELVVVDAPAPIWRDHILQVVEVLHLSAAAERADGLPPVPVRAVGPVAFWLLCHDGTEGDGECERVRGAGGASPARTPAPCRTRCNIRAP